jgi:hypothetical protein
MIPVLSLWLPILLSAVLVFLASWVMHALLGYHAADYAPLPSEDDIGAAFREAGVAPGDYTMPYASGMKEMETEEYKEKLKRGPVALLTVRRSGPVSMGPMLGQWFLYNLVISVFAGYLASRAVVPGGEAAEVFRFATTATVLAYVFGSWSESIWFGRKWSTTLKNTFDGLVYGAITGAVFVWLWPGA